MVIMFKTNKCNQLRLDDPLTSMPKYLNKILENSWAHYFRKHIFPNINEDRFSVLYSDKNSRPNTPVNIIIGLLTLKELMKLTDEELIGSLHFDLRYQYALCTTSMEKQPVSINTLYNFRQRVYEYTQKTGIDLIEKESEHLSKVIAELLEIDESLNRMDSFMVSSSCKNMSRTELVYATNYKFIKQLEKIDKNLIPEECLCYLEKGHKNETIYKSKSSEIESKLEKLLRHSILLYETFNNSTDEIKNTESYQLLKRMIEDQSNYDEVNDNYIVKEGKDIAPDSLQNPNDPDATYRYKYGDNNGYTVNVLENFNANTGVISSYDIKENIYSDTKFSKDVIDEMVKTKKPKKILVDSGYHSQEVAKKAKEKNIEIIPGELKGRKPSKDKISPCEFEVDEKKKQIVLCPNNKKPISSKYNKNTKMYRAKFSKKDCNNCLLKDKCRIKKQKKSNLIQFSSNHYKNSKLRKKMSTKEYIELTNKRSGVEGIPSVMRRRYNIDTVPVRGKVRLKFWLGFKVIAYNFKKLLKELPFLYFGSKIWKSLQNKLKIQKNGKLEIFKHLKVQKNFGVLVG